jgi:hypothetical protein
MEATSSKAITNDSVTANHNPPSPPSFPFCYPAEGAVFLGGTGQPRQRESSGGWLCADAKRPSVLRRTETTRELYTVSVTIAQCRVTYGGRSLSP